MIALADLAHSGPESLVNLTELSNRQNLSIHYLEQLFVKLRRAGLVKSVRGPGGGYKLAKSPESIRITEILEAVDETVNALYTGAGASGALFFLPFLRPTWFTPKPVDGNAVLNLTLNGIAMKAKISSIQWTLSDNFRPAFQNQKCGSCFMYFELVSGLFVVHLIFELCDGIIDCHFNGKKILCAER